MNDKARFLVGVISSGMNSIVPGGGSKVGTGESGSGEFGSGAFGTGAFGACGVGSCEFGSCDMEFGSGEGDVSISRKPRGYEN
jgi:hypothetical protein